MFSTGQAVEGAVPATASNAVCGTIATGDAMLRDDNQANWTLPANQACASPIGSKWIASITNWLAFLVDRADIPFHPGTNCQDPLTFYNAVISLIHREINSAFLNCEGDPIIIGNSLALCSEVPGSTPFIDCEGAAIAPGAAIATCADLDALVLTPFNPFTATGIGAIIIAPTPSDGSSYATNATLASTSVMLRPFGAGTPANFHDNVGNVYTFIDNRWPGAGVDGGAWKLISIGSSIGGSQFNGTWLKIS